MVPSTATQKFLQIISKLMSTDAIQEKVDSIVGVVKLVTKMIKENYTHIFSWGISHNKCGIQKSDIGRDHEN